MGTTLTGTTPQDTYDSLIKVTDNGPIGATPKYLSDGLGTDSSLALSTKNILIGTTTAVVNYGRELTVDATALTSEPEAFLALKGNRVSGNIAAVPFYNGAQQVGSITMQAEGNMRLLTGTTTANTSEKVRITADGNVGIGTTAPEVVASSNALQVNGAEHSFVRTGTTAFGGYLATVPIVGVTAISNARNPITGTYNNTGVAASVISLFSESANSYITFSTATANNSNPSERVRVTSNGLTFNGDTAAANALDDYEEGTFTATLVPSTSGSISLFSTFETLSYTKIGRQVTVKGLLLVQSVSSPVGTEVKIQGLPFVTANAGSGRGSGSVFVVGNSFNSAVSHGQNVSEISVVYDASTISGAANSDWYITFTYFV